MAQKMCDLCGVRPAAVRVAVIQDRKTRQIDVCDYHYAQLSRHQRQVSPLESLFRGGLFDDFFGDQPPGGTPPTSFVPSGAAGEAEPARVKVLVAAVMQPKAV